MEHLLHSVVNAIQIDNKTTLNNQKLRVVLLYVIRSFLIVHVAFKKDRFRLSIKFRRYGLCQEIFMNKQCQSGERNINNHHYKVGKIRLAK